MLDISMVFYERVTWGPTRNESVGEQ